MFSLLNNMYTYIMWKTILDTVKKNPRLRNIVLIRLQEIQYAVQQMKEDIINL